LRASRYEQHEVLVGAAGVDYAKGGLDWILEEVREGEGAGGAEGVRALVG